MFRHILSMLLLCMGFAALAKPTMIKPWSADESKTWILHVSPLPKSVEITGRAVRSRGAIRVVPRSGLDMLGTRAVRELMESIGHYEDVRFVGPWSFTIAPQIGGPDAEPLRRLRNSEQAYRIIAGENNKGLKLVALDSRGLYYASKTLQQLIKAYSKGDEIVIPIANVTDWPDLEYRGLWGADNAEPENLAWVARVKMNLAEQIAAVGVDESGRPWAKLKSGREPMVEIGPGYGIMPISSILHLEQVGNKGVFQAYPNLKAQGGQEGAICYSQPEIVDIIAGWLIDLGRLYPEVDVWLAENLHQQGGCRCEECAKTDRNVLEARTVFAAWRRARETIPELKIIILTSEETESSNERIFAELPEGVKVWYYHSLLTYTAGDDQMIRPYIAETARKGRWIGVCPSLVPYVHFTQPFTGADFVRARMNEFVDKGLSGLMGYIVPRLRYAAFNLEAAAEWSWNARGRTSREFALSYAVRHGIKHPERFAEWSETLGPVAWDVYASDWPGGQQRTVSPPVARQLREGTLPHLGYVLWDAYRTPFGGIATEKQLNLDVEAAEKAVRIARQMGDEEWIQESLVVQGYIRSLKALWELRGLTKPDGSVSDRNAAGNHFRMYVSGLDQAAQALQKWEACINDGKRPDEAFTDKPVSFIHDMIEQMTAVAQEYGIEL